jgi:hypothetical protein
MKLNIDQVHFLTEALNAVTIKATGARAVVEIQEILSKEFVRLQKLQGKQENK